MRNEKVLLSMRVLDLSDPLLSLVEKTYLDSFPVEERRDFVLVKELLKHNSSFKMYAILQDQLYVGFITSWTFEGFIYVEHFAIDESVRNGGLGSAAMKSFLALCNSPVVLEVELPEDYMSRRRVGFYERLGFKFDTHPYLQPPYRPEDSAFELRLMTYGELDMATSFESVKRIIHSNVYGVK